MFGGHVGTRGAGMQTMAVGVDQGMVIYKLLKDGIMLCAEASP